MVPLNRSSVVYPPVFIQHPKQSKDTLLAGMMVHILTEVWKVGPDKERTYGRDPTGHAMDRQS